MNETGIRLRQNEDNERFIEGVWAIFTHGNAVGLGEAFRVERRRVRIETWLIS